MTFVIPPFGRLAGPNRSAATYDTSTHRPAQKHNNTECSVYCHSWTISESIWNVLVYAFVSLNFRPTTALQFIFNCIHLENNLILFATVCAPMLVKLRMYAFWMKGILWSLSTTIDQGWTIFPNHIRRTEKCAPTKNNNNLRTQTDSHCRIASSHRSHCIHS